MENKMENQKMTDGKTSQVNKIYRRLIEVEVYFDGSMSRSQITKLMRQALESKIKPENISSMRETFCEEAN